MQNERHRAFEIDRGNKGDREGANTHTSADHEICRGVGRNMRRMAALGSAHPYNAS